MFPRYDISSISKNGYSKNDICVNICRWISFSYILPFASGEEKVNGMITWDRNAPSTRLTIPVSRYPNLRFADSLSRLRYRWYIRSTSARGRRHVSGPGCVDRCRCCWTGRRILCLPLSRHILRWFLFLLRLRRWNFTQDYHAGLAAYDH